MIKAMNKPKPEYLLLAVLITAVFSLIVFLIALAIAENAYARTHDLAVYHRSFLWMQWSEKQQVTIGMLSTPTLLFSVVIPTIVYAFLHPVIGKVVASASHALASQLDLVLDQKGELAKWNANALLIFGALWPVSMALIPFEVIALVFCHIYKSLWS
jgi:hypothetical protein